MDPPLQTISHKKEYRGKNPNPGDPGRIRNIYTDSFQIKWRLHCPKCFCHLVFPGFHEHQAPWQSAVHPKIWNPLPMKGKWCTRSVQFGLWGNKLVRIICFKHVMFWTCNVPTQTLKLEFSLKSSNQISHHSRVVKSTNRFGAYLSPSLSSTWCDYYYVAQLQNAPSCCWLTCQSASQAQLSITGYLWEVKVPLFKSPTWVSHCLFFWLVLGRNTAILFTELLKCMGPDCAR